MKIRLFYLFTLLLVCTQAFTQLSILPYGSTWKYLDNGSNQGTAWTTTSFNDANWAQGTALLGYGRGDEATVVSFGPTATNKYLTTYFRKTISIADVTLFSGYILNIRRDDGAVVYINGTEVFRSNMPGGAITYTTLADGNVADNGNTPQSKSLTISQLQQGTNVIAVEIHQYDKASTDIAFDMELTGTPANLLIPFESSWKYLDNGSNQGTAWRAALFNDLSWATGNAKFGYGITDAATVINYGADPNNKYITTYFRKSISIPDISIYTSFTIYVKRDDGVVIYVNGTEVVHDNISVNNFDYLRLSNSSLDNGYVAHSFNISKAAFNNGTNVIAAEVHQAGANTTDCAFDMELAGNTNPSLTQGPYLNLGTQTGMIIHWKTDVATSSKVSFGTSAGNLTESLTDNTLTTNHIIQLSGLIANTKYYYSIGSINTTFQGDLNNYFKTSPAPGSNEKIRILAMGDMGNNSSNQVNVRNAYLNYKGSNYTDVWMLLGDNAYESGLATEYQTNFFNIYQGNLTKNHVLWPAPGNHDYANNSARQADHNIPYYDVFSLPANGEAGGVASGTEAYYSYNYGNIHFVSLDSYGWEAGNTRLYDTTGPQVTWLKQDLAANTQKWTVVYFHHPPYSKGSHNSDTETELKKLRENLVRILERYKVDLVLSGHSHSYERSFLINGHYDLENSFNSEQHALSTSSAKYDGSDDSCPYIKDSTETRNGIVYVVVGVSGQVGGSSPGYPHDAMEYSNVTNGGSMVIEVENNRLDAKFICSDGVIRDNFTILKQVNKTIDTTVSAGAQTTLTASWEGDFVWSTGETTRSITVSPSSNAIYSVHDNFNCLNDLFNVTVSSTLDIMLSADSIFCPGGTSIVTVGATGGIPPYTGTGNFPVSAGIYDYTITDANGSTANKSLTIGEPSAIVLDSESHADAICNGTSTGSITLGAVSGGTAPYLYTWTKTGDVDFSASTANLVSLTAGTYHYSVTDANNCVPITGSVVIGEPDIISVGSSSYVDVDCNGAATGSIILGTVSGGATPYSYSWTKVGDPGFSSSIGNLSGLKAGTYNFSVTDANSCAAVTGGVIIGEPDVISVGVGSYVDVNCHGTATGSIVLGTLSGGTPPYLYTWTKDGDPGFSASTENLSDLSAGTYNYNVTDANACLPATGSIVIGEPAALSILAISGDNGTISPEGTKIVDCEGSQTYTITPAPCYRIADLVVDGVSRLNEIVNGNFTFTNVTVSHTINVTFSLNTYAITVTQNANGVITPATATVGCGSTQTFSIVAAPCYHIIDVMVDGVSVGAVSSYTFDDVTADHSITATYAINTNTITATQTSNGSITPGTTTAACGSDQTFSIAAASCYRIDDVVVDGVSVGAVSSYTFNNVTADHTITAIYAINTNAITVLQTSNGIITPVTITVACGGEQTFSISAASCYRIVDVKVDGVSVGAVSSYTFNNVTTDHTITATYAVNTNTITVLQTSNGTITPVTATVDCGTNQTFSIAAASCYRIDDVVVDGVSVGAVSSYTFNNVTADHTITATYAVNTFNITASPGANGTITPAGVLTIGCAASQTYLISPASCYQVTNVLVDGISIGAVNSYTFNNITANHTISAVFTIVPVNAGTLTGAASVCVGSNISLNSSVGGGNWSSSNPGVATIAAGTGIVTGVTAGTVTMTYTVANACGSGSATKSITVVAAGTITGSSTTCVGSTITLSNSLGGGKWSSSNTSVATVNANNGKVTGVSAGNAIIIYTVNGCTATFGITVRSSTVTAGTVNGTTPLCIGATTTYSSTGGTAGGTWSSTNTSVATVAAATGVVTAVGGGTTNITYTVPGCNGAVSSSKTLTVSTSVSAGTITGVTTLCAGATTNYTSSGTTGGNWSSDNTAFATVNSASGLVTGVSAGSANITYSISNSCGSASVSKTITITACSGPTITCPSNITQDLVAGCSKSVTVPNPTISNTATLTWVMSGASSGSSIATGVNYLGTRTFNNGLTTITYTARSAAGISVTCQFSVIIVDKIAPTITCPANISQAANGNNCSKSIAVPNPAIADNCSVTTLTWIMSGATTGSSSGTGVNYVSTKSFNVGTTTIIYTARDAANNISTCSFNVSVTNTRCPGGQTTPLVSSRSASIESAPQTTTPDNNLAIKAYPNPTANKFVLVVTSSDQENVEILVTDIYGRKVFHTKGSVNQKHSFGGNLVSGMYIVRVFQGMNIKTLKLIKEK